MDPLLVPHPLMPYLVIAFFAVIGVRILQVYNNRTVNPYRWTWVAYLLPIGVIALGVTEIAYSTN